MTDRGEDCSVVSSYLDNIIAGTKYSNLELSEALTKWRFLFIKSVLRVSNITGDSVEDVASDVLIPIIRIDVTYNKTQYRYLGKVYDLIFDYGSFVRLRTPEFSQLKTRKDFFISKGKVSLIKKASLSSLVYHKMNQTTKLMLRNHFTQKNGYTVIGEKKGIAKIRGNTFLRGYKECNFKQVSKISEVSLYEPVGDSEGSYLLDIISSKDFTQEDYLEVSILYKAIKRGLSENAKIVYSCLVRNPRMSEISLKNSTGLSHRQVKFAKREIALQTDKVLDREEKSIYSPYAIYKGMHLFIDSETDDRYLLRFPGTDKKISVKKGLVSIDYIKYRTPVKLRSCLV